MENQGSSGSAGSHWERVVLGNDVMTASVISGNADFSFLNVAAL